MEEADAAARARAVARRHGEVADLRRFATGLCHYVYDVTLRDGSGLVVRVADPANAGLIAGGCRWNPLLRDLGVPLPRLLEHDLTPSSGCGGVMVLERLPGTDLGEVYADLTATERGMVAQAVAAAQQATGQLPQGSGFGYVTSPDGPFPHRDWASVVGANLRRSSARAAPPDGGAAVGRALERMRPTLDAVAPTPFLDDTTTKNVLVHRGRLSGIVDADVVCYGDPLYAVALTQVALLSQGHPLDYTAAWLAALRPTGGHAERRLALYRAVFALDLLSEHGVVFNRSAPETVDPLGQDRLLACLDAALGVVG